MMTRRDCLVGGGLLVAGQPGLVRAGSPAVNQKLDARIADPRFNTELIGRLQGDLSGRQRWIHNPGFVFATVPGQGLAPGEFGRLLYRVEGFTARISRLLDDGSVEERSHSWMFYRHADEDRWLETFENPWSGEMLEAPPYRGGPTHSWLHPATGPELEGGAGLESTAIGRPTKLNWRIHDSAVWLTRHAASRLQAGTTVRNEFSIDQWICRLDEALDSRHRHVPATYSWTSQAQWQPWLRMGDRPGGLLWRIDSVVLDDVEQLPVAFVERMEKLLPGKLRQRLTW
ncbi:MAG: DUF1838 domain-containing protein [Gammaproteobacteria bacterium]|jgi:hypothetical protein|nr:DUF1838 domain-containing protein [Gammaproteobacteria bacterium]